jgi:hypothetical protein
MKEGLRQHFSSLVSIFFNSQGITSQHVQEILSSCPNLLSIRAYEIQAKDIRDGSEWVCTRLKCFRIRVSGMVEERKEKKNEKEGIYKMVYKQLSRLTELCELDISQNIEKVENELKLNLKCDLNELSGLKQLKYISVIGCRQQLTSKDVDWIIHHWKQLRVWEGTLNSSNLHLNQEYVRKLKKVGVRCRIYHRSEVGGPYDEDLYYNSL